MSEFFFSFYFYIFALWLLSLTILFLPTALFYLLKIRYNSK